MGWRKEPKRLPPARAKPEAGDYTEKAISTEVLKKTVTSPVTTYPLALGIIGALGCLILGPLPIFIYAAIGGSGVGLGSWIVNYFFRGEALTYKHLQELRKRAEEYNEWKKQQIRENLEDCIEIAGANEYVERGIQQFDQVSRTVNDLIDLLMEKLQTGELTFGRFFAAAENAAFTVLDNLNAVVTTLKAIRSVDERFLRARIEQLQRNQTPSARVEKEVKTLSDRLQLKIDNLDQIKDLLVANEEIITQLEMRTVDIGRMKTGEKYANGSTMDEVVAGLQAIAARAEKYR
ncbi:TPA: hypothetical protein DF272_03885 [Candidatus Falkowbacteria bacterium]|nr:hypothetical protein [Candidatus Falkowbacteria bacterium]